MPDKIPKKRRFRCSKKGVVNVRVLSGLSALQQEWIS